MSRWEGDDQAVVGAPVRRSGSNTVVRARAWRIGAEWQLDVLPGVIRPYNRPEFHEDPAITLTSYPGTIRQLVVTGLGRDVPAAIVTNDNSIKTRALIS
jgi:hypothetical protein